MKVLGTDKQFTTDDDVEADLYNDWNEEEQHELGQFESGRPNRPARSRERQHAQLDVDHQLTWWSEESVIEECRQTTE